MFQSVSKELKQKKQQLYSYTVSWSLSVSCAGSPKMSSIISSVSSSRSLSNSALALPEGKFEQWMHSHPSEHSQPFFLHPHLDVLHPDLHLQPFVRKLTLSFIVAMFSLLSHSISRIPSVNFQPNDVSGANCSCWWSACPHISMTQQDHSQWRHRAAVEGIISLSAVVLSQIFSLQSCNHTSSGDGPVSRKHL